MQLASEGFFVSAARLVCVWSLRRRHYRNQMPREILSAKPSMRSRR